MIFYRVSTLLQACLSKLQRFLQQDNLEARNLMMDHLIEPNRIDIVWSRQSIVVTRIVKLTRPSSLRYLLITFNLESRRSHSTISTYRIPRPRYIPSKWSPNVCSRKSSTLIIIPTYTGSIRLIWNQWRRMQSVREGISTTLLRSPLKSSASLYLIAINNARGNPPCNRYEPSSSNP